MKVVTFNWKKDFKEIPSLLVKLDINRLRMQFASPEKAGPLLREAVVNYWENKSKGYSALAARVFNDKRLTNY